MSNERPIITVYVHPPIPDRRYDWIAYRDGDEEAGPTGRGRTKEEAKAALLALEEEQRADALVKGYLSALATITTGKIGDKEREAIAKVLVALHARVEALEARHGA